jgi:hypothetical protein
MGWETRRGKSYYYQKRRVGSKVVSVYIGSGPEASMLAAEAEKRASERDERRLIEMQSHHQDVSSDGMLETTLQALAELRQAFGIYKQNEEWKRRSEI